MPGPALSQLECSCSVAMASEDWLELFGSDDEAPLAEEHDPEQERGKSLVEFFFSSFAERSKASLEDPISAFTDKKPALTRTLSS